MGTNYYFTKRTRACLHCGRADEERLHIGKSAIGWCFALRIYPERGINGLDDWLKLWPTGHIENEYGEALLWIDMKRIVCEREHPKGLLRIPLRSETGASRDAVKHGEGTWDCLDYEYS